MVTHIIVGTIVLLMGRKLFWLFVGCLGFIAGVKYAGLFVETEAELIVYAVAAVTGIIGVAVAILLQNLAIGMAGFMAGGYLTLRLVEIIGFNHSQFLWAVCLTGGIVGAALMVLIFDWALILISSFLGSSLIIEGLAHYYTTMDPFLLQSTFFGMIIFGIAVQARLKETDAGPGAGSAGRLR